jgi:hypothetical protein
LRNNCTQLRAFLAVLELQLKELSPIAQRLHSAARFPCCVGTAIERTLTDCATTALNNQRSWNFPRSRHMIDWVNQYFVRLVRLGIQVKQNDQMSF